MKRFLLLFLVATLSTVSFAQPPASSIPYKDFDVKFEIAPFEFGVTGENTVSLIGYDFKKNLNQEIVEIPSSVTYNSKSYTVTAINGRDNRMTWNGCVFPCLKKIKSVHIPSSVISIGGYTFYGCWGITKINIPPSVRYIGKGAFMSCRSIPEIEITSPEIVIDDYAFANCQGVRLMKITSQNASIGQDIFPQANSVLRELHVRQAIRPYVLGLKSNPLIVIIDEPQQNVAHGGTYIAAAPVVQQPIAETPKILSDVDQNIPQTALKNENTFAVIIANEKYTTESTVDFALNDGKVFKEYCEKTLGIPSENIRFVENGTLGSIGAGIEWLQKVLEVYKQDANAIVYYSGHGIPNEATGDAYLLPTDCQGSNFKYAYSINRLYKELGEAGAKSVTYFIDACFSGTQRKGEMMVAARGVAIKAKSGVLSGNSVAFAAASGDETAFAYEEKGHGMFTYFLLKKLQETKGEVSYGELADYIQQNVKQKSIVVSPRLQSPNAISSSLASEGWQSWKLTK